MSLLPAFFPSRDVLLYISEFQDDIDAIEMLTTFKQIHSYLYKYKLKQSVAVESI